MGNLNTQMVIKQLTKRKSEMVQVITFREKKGFSNFKEGKQEMAVGANKIIDLELEI